VYGLRGGSYDVVVYGEHGMVVWWVIALGIALGLLPRARPSRLGLALLAALIAYAAWVALSLVWTESSERTTNEVARVLGYAGIVALVACCLDRRTWRAAAAGLGCGAVVVCLMALGSRLEPSIFPTDYAAASLRTDRLAYPFGYWNAVAAWAAMSATIALAWSVHDRDRIRRATWLAAVPVACLTVYLTYSRAGAAGTILGAILVVALSRNRLTALIHVVIAAGGTAMAIAVVRGAPRIAHATGTQGAGGVLAVLLLAAVACASTAALTQAASADRWRIPRRAARPALAASAVIIVGLGLVFGPHIVRNAWHSFKRGTLVASTDPAARLTSLGGTRYSRWKA
jgi:hypothetical protein